MPLGVNVTFRRRALLLAALVLGAIVAAQPGAAHHHPQRPFQPWTDDRPHSKPRKRDKRVRQIFHWPSPCYLDTAPVIFPGPGASLRPPFSDPKAVPPAVPSNLP